MSTDLSVDAPAFNPGGGSNPSYSTHRGQGRPAHNGTYRTGGQGLPPYVTSCYPFVVSTPGGHHRNSFENQTFGDAFAVDVTGSASWAHAEAVSYRPSVPLAYGYAAVPPPLPSAALLPPYNWSHGSSYHYSGAGLSAAGCAAYTGYDDQTFVDAPRGRQDRKKSGRRNGGPAGPQAAAATGPSKRWQQQHRGRREQTSSQEDVQGSTSVHVTSAMPKRNAVSVGTQNDPLRANQNQIGDGFPKADRARSHTKMLRDVCLQTDFADEIASLTLEAKPNSLYSAGRSSYNYASAVRQDRPGDMDSDSGYSSAMKRAAAAAAAAAAVAAVPREATRMLAQQQGHGSGSRSVATAAHETSASHPAEPKLSHRPAGSSGGPAATEGLSCNGKHGSLMRTQSAPTSALTSSAAVQMKSWTDNTNNDGCARLSGGLAGSSSGTAEMGGGHRRRRRRRRKQNGGAAEAGTVEPDRADSAASTGEGEYSADEGSGCVDDGDAAAFHRAAGPVSNEGNDFPELMAGVTCLVPGSVSRATGVNTSASSYSQALKSAQFSLSKHAESAPPMPWTGGPAPRAGGPAPRAGGPAQRSDTQDDDEGFMFTSVAYNNREAVSSIADQHASGSRRPNLLLVASSDAAAASSRRQKKLVHAQLAAAEEQMEISLEQQVLLGKLGRIGPAARANVASSAGPALGKKSSQPMALNLSDMIAAAAAKKMDPARLHENVPNKKSGDTPTQRGRSTVAVAPNALDSSAPTVKRGKERENPRPKRPSPLKKVILKEREGKKQSRAATTATPPGGQLSCDDGSEPLGDDRTEPSSSSTEGRSSGVHRNKEQQQQSEAACLRPQEALSLDVSFEGVVSIAGDASGRVSSRSGDVFTPASQASQPLSPISQTSPVSMSPLSVSSSPFASEVGTPIRPAAVAKDIQLQQEIAQKIHSRRFREYCDHLLDKDIDDCCTTLLQELVRFQERLFARDPVKAKTRRRLVLGLREVTKHLRLRKIKLVIISPNLERIESKGGLDEALTTIVALCREQSVPLVFALGRRALGRACGKIVPVSVTGIFMYDGAEAHFKRLMDLTHKAREAYEETVKLVALEAAAAAEEERRIVTSSSRGVPSSARTVDGGGSDNDDANSVGADTSAGAAGHALPTVPNAHRLSRSSSACSAVSQVSADDPASEASSNASLAQRHMHAEATTRRRKYVCNGDEGNEADIEDSLQESAALTDYRMLYNKQSASGPPAAAVGDSSADGLPAAHVPRESSQGLTAAQDDWAASLQPPRRHQPEQNEGDGSALAGSATVTCGSSGSSTKQSTDGGGSGVAEAAQRLAGVAVVLPSQLQLSSRDRVESWVVQSASIASPLDAVDGDPLVSDNDVAEFAATLSACTANSEALLMGGSIIPSSSSAQ